MLVRMAQSRPKNANHPKRGSSIKVEPIRDLAAIKTIKKQLADKPRDLCLFTFGINTAYRANELLSLNVGQVAHLKPGDRLDLKQSKNRKYRGTILNETVIRAVRGWLEQHPDPRAKAPLFPSQKSGDALSVSTLNNMLKVWCRDAGLKGNFGSHTLRKTWGYQQRVFKERPVALLMTAFGHSSEKQTLDYLGIEPDEICALYEMEL